VSDKKEGDGAATDALLRVAPDEKMGGVSREAGAPVSGDATRRITAAADAVTQQSVKKPNEAASVRSIRRIRPGA